LERSEPPAASMTEGCEPRAESMTVSETETEAVGRLRPAEDGRLPGRTWPAEAGRCFAEASGPQGFAGKAGRLCPSSNSGRTDASRDVERFGDSERLSAAVGGRSGGGSRLLVEATFQSGISARLWS